MNKLWTKTLITFVVGVAFVTAGPGQARAGGFDTPMLYSARHMGMGGAAVAYVNDASSLFHNPAGLGRTKKASLLLNLSPLFGTITTRPQDLSTIPQEGIESNTTFAPFFLLGGSYRATDWLTFGVAVYPVASAAASYDYERNVGANTLAVQDELTLLFLEVSPGVAVNFDDTAIGSFSLGFGYRITYVSLTRLQQNEGRDPFLDFDMSGFNFEGIRVGLQYRPPAIGDHLSFGLSYRSKTTTTLSTDQGIVLAQQVSDLETEFVLPSRLIAGTRVDAFDFALAFDFEWGFQSENTVSPFSGTLTDSGDSTTVPNIFNWSDAATIRVGLEYGGLQIDDYGIKLRGGYVFDDITANPQYPTAFGTPPTSTQVFTLGAGFDGGPWQVNVAYAYRFGSVDGVPADGGEDTPDDPTDDCAFCSAPGDYAINLSGVYVDFSWDFD